MKVSANIRETVTVLLFLTLIVGCTQEQKPRLEVVNYDQLFDIIKPSDDKLYVVNFWATWCKPCMEELPHFLELDADFRSNKKYEMILVSLDNPSNLKTGVVRVVQTMNIQPNVFLLDDAKRMNEWIPAINEDWSGSIPATAFYKNGVQLEFHEGQLTKEELNNLIQKYL
ncbi:MAG: thiol-disulfide isomerase/thioredoxin [bacterium]|jgi:thiol-disulfide isomerase/thioredoxin